MLFTIERMLFCLLILTIWSLDWLCCNWLVNITLICFPHTVESLRCWFIRCLIYKILGFFSFPLSLEIEIESCRQSTLNEGFIWEVDFISFDISIEFNGWRNLKVGTWTKKGMAARMTVYQNTFLNSKYWTRMWQPEKNANIDL